MQCETWTGRKGMGVWQYCHPGWVRSSVAAIVLFNKRRHDATLPDRHTQHAMKLHSNSVSIQLHFDTTYRVTARSSLVVAQSNTDFHFNTHWRGDNKTQHAQEKERDASANSRPCKDGKLTNCMPHPLRLPHCIPKIAKATAALLGNNGEHFERPWKCHSCSSFWSYCIGCRSS